MTLRIISSINLLKCGIKCCIIPDKYEFFPLHIMDMEDYDEEDI